MPGGKTFWRFLEKFLENLRVICILYITFRMMNPNETERDDQGLQVAEIAKKAMNTQHIGDKEIVSSAIREHLNDKRLKEFEAKHAGQLVMAEYGNFLLGRSAGSQVLLGTSWMPTSNLTLKSFKDYELREPADSVSHSHNYKRISECTGEEMVAGTYVITHAVGKLLCAEKDSSSEQPPAVIADVVTVQSVKPGEAKSFPKPPVDILYPSMEININKLIDAKGLGVIILQGADAASYILEKTDAIEIKKEEVDRYIRSEDDFDCCQDPYGKKNETSDKWGMFRLKGKLVFSIPSLTRLLHNLPYPTPAEEYERQLNGLVTIINMLRNMAEFRASGTTKEDLLQVMKEFASHGGSSSMAKASDEVSRLLPNSNLSGSTWKLAGPKARRSLDENTIRESAFKNRSLGGSRGGQASAPIRRQQLDEKYHEANSDVSTIAVECPFCNKNLVTLESLRIHCNSNCEIKNMYNGKCGAPRKRCRKVK